MIDRDLRTQLSQDLRRLVTGRMTNDEFDDVYFDQYCESNDQSIVEIADFGQSLYSDIPTYRLKGRRAVDRATRRVAARCVLFLCSDQEYSWPRWPHSTGMLRLISIVVGFGPTLGSALGICFLLVIANGDIRDTALMWPFVLFWPLGVIGLVSFLFSTWYLCCEGHRRILKVSPQWQAWLRHGDYDVWPFRWREDFYDARRKPYLLAGPRRTP